MQQEKLYFREIISEIEKYLQTDDVIVLHGARQVGKTHILYYLKEKLDKKKRKNIYLDLEDSRLVAVIDRGVESFLKLLEEEGFSKEEKVTVFIDEIQYLEDPSSFLKLISDHYKNLKLIVSGSSSFNIKSKFKDSLVGRTVNFEIFPLSFAEFLKFKEYEVDFRKVGTDKKIEELRSLFREYTLYGGYPKIVLTTDLEIKEKYLQQIIDTYVRKDIRDLAEIRGIASFNKLLEVLASQSGQLLNVLELSNTCHLAKATVENYLFILENTYIIKLVYPYSKNIRSELFKTPKIFFYDSGLMQMLWLKTLQKEIMGNVFETVIFSELIKKYIKENVYFWRTADKKEIDFIVKIRNQVLPVEVKLSFSQFKKTHINYFLKKYQLEKFKLVALRGDKTEEQAIFPWELL